MTNKLELLKQNTVVVADTGDFETGRIYNVQDATTNPSLILQAAKNPKFEHLIQSSIDFAIEQKKINPEVDVLSLAMDKCIVNFGCEWLKFIPGKVSTEIDARLSFDIEATVKKGKELISLYEKSGVDKSRVLLKIAATWEGIQAAKILESEGYHTNITLLFALVQAIAAAQNANAFLISPFVGRILDWHKKAKGVDNFPREQDPGVLSVRQIYAYFKKYNLNTIVMGASFRNTDEIEELCGCDYLTISPDLMQKLQDSQGPLPRKLSPEGPWDENITQIQIDEKTFRWMLNEDACATEKLSEGIRRFGADIVILENELSKRINK